MNRGVTSVILIVISANINLASASNQVLLKSRRFTPAKGITDAARVKIEAIPGRAHVLMQLDRIPTVKERKELEAKGIKLLAYIPNKAWFASIPSDKSSQIAALSDVAAISEILPEDKIDHSIKEKGVNNYSTNEKGEAKLVVLFFSDVSLNHASTVVLSHRGGVVGAAPIINALVIYLPEDQIYQLARHDSVQWIDQHYEGIDFNDGLRAAIHANAVQDPPYNLDGTDVIVGQWETWHPDDTHSDLEGRITNISDGWDISSHATHVAGTLLGNGSINWTYRGVATNARIVSYHRWINVAELYAHYNEAINTYNIKVSNNSWGYIDYDGEYDVYTQAEDSVVTGACGKRISIIQAAGNEGEFGLWTLASIAVAKNIVTVGATNSNDDSLWYNSSRGPTAGSTRRPARSRLRKPRNSSSSQI